MDNEQFIKIRKQIDIELNITPDNVHMKAIEAPLYTSRYYNIYINEKRILDNTVAKRDKVYYDLWIEHKYNKQYTLNTKLEVEAFIYSNEKYQSLVRKCKEQEYVVDYFDEHIKVFKNLTYACTTFLNYRKLKEGK